MDGTTLFERGVEAGTPPTGRVYARVVVERGIESGTGEDGLTYRCDDAGAIPAPGDRVEVPLGKSGKQAQGVVVCVGGPELLDGLAPSRVKAIGRRTGAALPAALLSLAEWMAQYYVCPLGMVLATLVPAAVKRGTGARELEVVDIAPIDGGTLELGRASKKAWGAITALEPGALPVEIRALAARLNLKSLRTLRDLISAGALTRTVSSSVRASPLPVFAGEDGPADAVTLTREQCVVVDGVRAAGDGFQVHLVRGVTGSGKTEVYLRLLGAVLEAGKTGIVLVPEIALTPQTSARFTRRFGPCLLYTSPSPRD